MSYSTAVGVQNPTTARVETTLEAVDGRVVNLRERAANVAGRMAATLSRAYGDPPGTNPQAGKPVAVPLGTVGSLTEHLDHLEGCITEQESLCNRLESLA